MRTLEELIMLSEQYFDPKEVDRVIIYGDKADYFAPLMDNLLPYEVNYMYTNTPDIIENKVLLIYTGGLFKDKNALS